MLHGRNKIPACPLGGVNIGLLGLLHRCVCLHALVCVLYGTRWGCGVMFSCASVCSPSRRHTRTLAGSGGDGDRAARRDCVHRGRGPPEGPAFPCRGPALYTASGETQEQTRMGDCAGTCMCMGVYVGVVHVLPSIFEHACTCHV